MRRFFCIPILLILIACLQSCFRSESDSSLFDDVPIVFDIDTVNKVALKLGDIRYVPLETNDDCLIGDIDEVQIRNGKIYIADFDKAMALFVFDINGKFLYKISKKGQGPGEYISMYGFDIHKNGDIYIFDPFGKKILIYSIEGKCLSEINFDYYFKDFCLVENKIYLFEITASGGKKTADLAVYNMEDKRTTNLLSEKKHLFRSPFKFGSSSFFYSPNNIYYAPMFSPIIFAVNEDNITPAIGVKNLHLLPEHVLDEWMEEQNKNRLIELIQKTDYFTIHTLVFETDEYLTFQSKKGSRTLGVMLYNKTTKSAYTIKESSFFDTIGCGIVQGSTGKEFFGIIHLMPELEQHKRLLETREELKNRHEEDNPVIVFFNLDM